MSSWQFDVSTFMVLLNVEEERHFRLIRRRWLDIWSAAPVAGLQTYLSNKNDITEATGLTYTSPYGGKKAPLRNMRVSRLITLKDLLDDGSIVFYRIREKEKGNSSLASTFKHICGAKLSLLLTITTWTIFGGFLGLSMMLPSITWIGISNLSALCAWSIILRSIDRYIWVPQKYSSSYPNRHDAAVFLGRRNSAFVLEGSREDVSKWTGAGLSLRKSSRASALHALSRLGTVALLIFIFCTIPNGSTQDQVLFISYNILGQANTWLGQRLHSKYSMSRLEKMKIEETKQRTHVYAALIKRCGDGEWVDKTELLPRDKQWALWRKKIYESKVDAKKLWEECGDIIAREDARPKVDPGEPKSSGGDDSSTTTTVEEDLGANGSVNIPLKTLSGGGDSSSTT